MNRTDFTIRARRADIRCGADLIRLFAIQQKEDGICYVAQKLELKAAEEGLVVDSFLEINIQEAQRLIDDLWDCGLRPSEGTGSAGAMKAVENHLADMKTIVFHVLKIDKIDNK